MNNADAQHLHLINYLQSPQERRDKYLIIRHAGLSWQTAQKMRDWTWPHINTFLHNFEKQTPYKDQRDYKKQNGN